ncbi:GIN domain-containing protein [Sphingomonas sp.]|uniref:GIN domain-containing protein n=1 Tax=Sphingomonas sp. TaxID=28214 RepID=UPI003CC68FFF
MSDATLVRMRVLLCALLLIPATAHAAERRLYLSSFERIRVEGPYQVTVTTGRSPGGTLTGDAQAIDAIEVQVDGTTLVVRGVQREAGAARGVAGPVVVTLTTPTLSNAAVLGSGALAIAGGRTPRLDLSVAGAGSIAFTGVDTDQANATVVGNGAVTLAGRAVRARLSVSGAGRIAADALVAGDLTVRVDGPGEALARARYTAAVFNAGLGHIAVAGTPQCRVQNQAGGPVTCGAGAPAR